jgi:erythromycin esterase-like protein
MSRHDVDAVRAAAIALPSNGSVEPILDLIGDHTLVLLGEATHGTHEFYRIRADITCELIARKGFNVVAVEADWPDAFRPNRWVRGESPDTSARDALSDFERFPRWMWRNSDVVRFLTWLRDFNSSRGPREQAGFYGLDLYSLHRSIDAVLRYLRKVDPASEILARQRYACFDAFGVDTQAYGYATTLGLEQSCEQEVIRQLVELQRKAADYASRDGRVAAEDYFAAEQNARVVHDAEAYYRAMFGDGAASWNLRDRHMMSTLEAILGHVTRLNGSARAVVWAHNSHLGDARATQMSTFGELNVGQLVREAYGQAAISIGFTTHEGSVTAALNWDDPAGLMAVRPSLAGSYERLFHETGIHSFALDLRGSIADTLRAPRLERAIGVVYRPESERRSHYFTAVLPKQFDVVVHCDRTRAVEPLERWSRHEIDLPETWPTGV